MWTVWITLVCFHLRYRSNRKRVPNRDPRDHARRLETARNVESKTLKGNQAEHLKRQHSFKSPI